MFFGLQTLLSHPPCAGSAPAGQTPGDPGPRLSRLSVSDVTTSSLRLNWEAPPGAFDSFLLRYGVPSPSTLEPYPRPLLQRELTVPGTRHSAVLRDLRPGTPYSLTLYGLRGPHKADSIQGTARTLSPGKAPHRAHGPCPSVGAFALHRVGVVAQPGEGGRRWGNRRAASISLEERGGVSMSGEGGVAVLGQEPPCSAPSPQLPGTPFPSVLESPHDLQFSEIGETSATVSWMPPPSRVDSFKVSYQLADGGDSPLPMSSLALISPAPCTLPAPQFVRASLGNRPHTPCFQGSHRACKWTAGPGPRNSRG